MNFNNLIDKIGIWIKVIQTALIATIIFEGLLVIIIGVASNKIGDKFDLWVAILGACSVLYLMLLWFRTQYQLKFPASITDELRSKRELEEYEKSFSRQKILNEYINQAIRSLNDQTCNTNVGVKSPQMCDENLQVRIKELMNPILSNTNVILNNYQANKFTIGIYLNFYRKEPSDYSQVDLRYYSDNSVGLIDSSLVNDKGILILRDDFNLENTFIFKQMLNKDNLTNQYLEIKTAIKKSLNNIKFVSHPFKIKDEFYTIICSDMPQVCSDDKASGVTFIIIQGTYKPEEDLNYLLRIFNRLVANYVYKYNECVLNQIVSKKLNEEKKMETENLKA